MTLSSLATPHFATSYTLGAIGVVDGSISYLYSSVPLADVVARSDKIPLTALLRSYRQLQELPQTSSVLETPRPAGRSPGWGVGSLLKETKRLVEKPTMLYGRLHLPRSMLEALVIKRLSPSTQMQLMAVSNSQLRNGGTLLGVLQFDRGQYGIEGLASSDGGLLGLRGLYNFGGDASLKSRPSSSISGSTDEGAAAGDGIYGRFSVGGEIFYGTLNKSGGVSLGARFVTLPAHRGTPLTATLTINPLMGNICASYAVLAREYCSLATKFDFNVYSYESEWAVGTELWSKRRLAGLVGTEAGAVTPEMAISRWKDRSFRAKMEWRLDDPEPAEAATESYPNTGGPKPPTNGGEYHGILKARLDQNLKIRLLWEGRLKSLIFSLGTGVDLHKLDQPFRTLGLDIQYSS